ncbi:MAG: DUF131 domain-containing protein [Pyrobaculum sp.]
MLDLVFVAVVLIFTGLFVIMLSILLQALRSGEGKAEAGAVVMIGPVPIVLGTSRRAAFVAMALALTAMALLLALLAASFPK